MRFENKVVIVTGAAGGIGKEVARRLSSEGARLTLVDLDEGAVKTVAEELGLVEDRVLVLRADVSKELEVKNYVDRTMDKFGRIDGFVNNAGVEGAAKLIENVTEEDFDFVYGVNVKGAFYGLKYVLPVMKTQRMGAIVNMSSVAGLIGAPQMMLYNSSKHALMGINKVAALEAAEFNVRVNTVNPGVINTQMMRHIESKVAPGHADAAQSAYQEAVPMKRYGEPSEVASLVGFLLSDDAAYISSSTYTIDGALYSN